MKKYECVKGFSVEKSDGDGWGTDEYEIVKEGSQWIDQESDYRIAGGEIRLEQEDGTWLELPKETIGESFKEIA